MIRKCWGWLNRLARRRYQLSGWRHHSGYRLHSAGARPARIPWNADSAGMGERRSNHAYNLQPPDMLPATRLDQPDLRTPIAAGKHASEVRNHADIRFRRHYGKDARIRAPARPTPVRANRGVIAVSVSVCCQGVILWADSCFAVSGLSPALELAINVRIRGITSARHNTRSTQPPALRTFALVL